MIGSFRQWIVENNILDEANMKDIGTFASGRHNKGFGYYKQVIEKILNEEKVYLVIVDDTLKPTNNKSDNFISKKDFNIEELKSFLDFSPDVARENYKFFNSCWLGTINNGEDNSDLYKSPIWKYIYKSQFTGGRGANKGYTFESMFAEQFKKFMNGEPVDEIYTETFNQILKIVEKNKESKINDIVLKGKKNNKRPIDINGTDVSFSKRNELKLNGKGEEKLNIGETISDVTINWAKGDPTYLSLKHGDTVEQVNLGISWARDDIDKLFQKVKKDMIVPDEWTLPSNSKTAQFCNFFGIDINKLIYSIWNKENDISINSNIIKKLPKETFIIKKGSPLYKFILDCVGYGYIYVHFSKNKIHCVDLTKPESIDKIFDSDITAQIIYSFGSSKTYVKIHIKDEKDFFNGIFEIRPNNGQLSFNVANLKFNYIYDNLADVVK